MSKPEWARSAPGLVWRKQKAGWEARWQCRTDLVERGFETKSKQLWSGDAEPTEQEWAYIETSCGELQQAMLVFGRGGLPAMTVFDGTLESLMQCYRTDPDSSYHKLRYKTRIHYDDVMKLIGDDYGHETLADLKARIFLRWHEGWTDNGVKIASGHLKIGMLRTLFGFGATILEDAESARLSSILSKMKFKMAAPRTQRLTADQAIAIRKAAHEMRRPSIALAQAIQFECILRQKDVIGEWIPASEPGISDVVHKKNDEEWKWVRGLRWEEIDENLILTHVTSKKEKPLTVNLRNAPMVLEEFALIPYRPRSGPVVVSEFDCRPWDTPEFRRWWRVLADRCGIPKEVKNMDTRSGAITEASEAGAPIEHIKHAATHSQQQMTERYSRGPEAKIENVQMFRIRHRNKTGTDGG